MTPPDTHPETRPETHGRRAVLGLLGAGTTGAAVLLATGGAASAAPGSSAEIPTETAGPYPADGSNGPDVLLQDGIVRSDIRRSFGSSTTRAKGEPFRFTLVLVDTATGQPLEGLAVYAWHANRDGRYSLYSEGITGENYLRGVQVSNARGKVRFRSIYPACYDGRWPHIHFEVYADLATARASGTPLVTSQVALPRRQSMQVYRRAGGYDSSITNLDRVSLASDMVFGDDGGVHQLATMKGGVEKGYRARLVVPIEV